jgi:hypothetical protein
MTPRNLLRKMNPGQRVRFPATEERNAWPGGPSESVCLPSWSKSGQIAGPIADKDEERDDEER